MAEPPGRMANDGGVQVPQAAPDRQALIREILDHWGSVPAPPTSENRLPQGDLQAALKLATGEQLLNARRGRTFQDVMAALPKSASSVELVVPFAVGQPITPQSYGSTTSDLVYTPVTPCRIIDTRGGVAPWTGLLGPNSGRQFWVALSDYSPQGGVAASCGIPTSPYPAAVAINVTSTGQTGSGNLRVIETGGGTPNASLVNYVSGVNIANAAITRSNHIDVILHGDIYIYSANAQSHAVVDIMGYFSNLPTAGRAYAFVNPGSSPTFNGARTKGFSAVSQPSVGQYCLTPSDATVSPATVPWFTTIDWSNSSGADLMAFIRSTGIGCAAGDFTVLTFTFGANPAAPALSNNVAFQVFVP